MLTIGGASTVRVALAVAPDVSVRASDAVAHSASEAARATANDVENRIANQRGQVERVHPTFGCGMTINVKYQLWWR